jgi:N-acetylmuramic acid 6-phosphate (MurNAc-6-P) etherase
MRATGLDYDGAGRLLASADGRVKVALVMALRDVPPADAEALLRDAQGFVRRALEEPAE